MEPPAVSVIIPTFNRPQHTVRAVRSALAQSFTFIEVIVVDDGSDPPFALPEELRRDGRVTCLRRDDNEGAAAARNFGAEKARGEWLAWLDSDDWWHRDKLHRQIRYLERLGDRRRAVALATGFAYVDERGREEARIPVPGHDVEMFYAGCWFCPGSTVVMSRALFSRVGGFDTTLARHEDLDWYIRMAQAGGRLEVVPEVLAYIRKGPKPPLCVVKDAGAGMLAKHERGQGPIADLRAHLHLEYASSALKRERDIPVFLTHMAASLYWRPRLRLAVRAFWKRP